MQALVMLINLIMVMLSAMVAMAFYTLSERKFLGYFQHRKGPNKPSITALMIPMADATKLFMKEEKFTTSSNMKHYLIAPMMMIITTLLLWPLFPHLYQSYFMKLGVLYFLSITSINIYATFMAGWGSGSKWSLLGALRGVAQTISYEVTLSIIMICFIMHPASMSLFKIMQNQYSWLTIILLPLLLSWIISILAETHRAPFDFTEGESELVSGFNIEYSSSLFALIFMAEYMNILLMSLLTVMMSMSNMYNSELILKASIMSLIFIWARGALPRLRYDTLMNMLWKKMLPLSLMLMMTMSPLILLLN